MLEVSTFTAGLNASNVSDNVSNSYTCTTPQTSPSLSISFKCYKVSATVANPLNITVNTGNVSVFVEVWSGAGTNVGTPTSGAGAGATTTTVQPGSQNTTSGDLYVTGLASYAGVASVTSIDSSFVISQSETSPTVVNGGIAHIIASGSPLNPTWTQTNNTLGIAATMIAFCASTCGAPPPATLLMTSATLGSGGRIITVPISNCTADLSPASGITGFTVFNGASGVNVTSVTCTVTITLAAAQLSTDTLTVTLASGGSTNLTDSVLNTPTGQSGFAITNNSNRTGVTASSNSSNVYLPGYWTNGGTSSTSTYYPTAQNAWIELTCTTSTDAQILASSTGIRVSIDGGAFSTYTPGLGGNSWQPVMVGASSGTHILKIFAASFVNSSSLKCSSSAGAALTPIAAYQGASFNGATTTPYTSNAQNFGFPSTASGVGQLQWTTTNGCSSFNTDATSFGIVTYDFGNTWDVYKDGVLTNSATSPSDLEYGFLQLLTGTSGTHNYKACINDPPTDGTSLVLTQLVLNGGSATFTSAATSPVITTLACGDSIAAYLFMTLGRDGDFFVNTFGLGAGDQHRGFSGEKVLTFLRDTCPTVQLVSPVDAMWLTGGVNDQIQSSNVANFTTAYGVMMTNTAAASGMLKANVPLLIRNILPNCVATSAARGTYNAAIASAVTTYNGGSPSHLAILIRTDDWFDPSDMAMSGDCLHPADAGGLVIGNIETPVIAGLFGSSYTLTGPAHGVSGVASTFTVALKGAATWTGVGVATVSPAETLNCTATTVTGSFSPAMPFAPTQGQNSVTFTFTPSNAAIGTISCVHGATQDGWVDPAALNFNTIPASGSMMMGIF